jgi:predicted nucleotidyltransferase
MSAEALPTAEPLPSCLDELPLHRAAVERFVERLAPLDGVDAAFISGSVGRDEGEALSDLDLVLVAGDEGARAVLQSRAPQLFAELGDVLVVTQAVHITPTLWLGVLDGPLPVDLDIVGWEKEEPGAWLESFCIVKDAGGRLARIRQASQGPHPGYDAEWLQGLSERWWRWMFYVAKDNKRGDWLTALGNFEFLRANAFRPLLRTLAGLPPEGARLRGGARLDRVAATFALFDANEDSWDRALLAMHELFLELRAEVQSVTPHGVPEHEAQLGAALRTFIEAGP